MNDDTVSKLSKASKRQPAKVLSPQKKDVKPIRVTVVRKGYQDSCRMMLKP